MRPLFDRLRSRLNVGRSPVYNDLGRSERSFAADLEDAMMKLNLGYGLDEAARRDIEVGAEPLPRADTS